MPELLDVTAGVPMPPAAARLLRLASPAFPALLAIASRLRARGGAARGPGATATETHRSRVYATAWAADGRTASARYETGEAYAFAARAAVSATEAVLADGRPGAWSPAAAFGPAFLSGIAAGRIVDVELATPTRSAAQDGRP